MSIIMVDSNEQEARSYFAHEAAAYFAQNPKKTTYTACEIQKGCFFALKFGIDNDCVVVFRVSEYEEIYNYRQLIKEMKNG